MSGKANNDTAAREGYFGPFGGRFVPETLVAALDQLAAEFESAMADKAFLAEFDRCLREIGGRPSELYFCRRLTEKIGGARPPVTRPKKNTAAPPNARSVAAPTRRQKPP